MLEMLLIIMLMCEIKCIKKSIGYFSVQMVNNPENQFQFFTVSTEYKSKYFYQSFLTESLLSSPSQYNQYNEKR